MPRAFRVVVAVVALAAAASARVGASAARIDALAR
jgi:hypothetical protein